MIPRVVALRLALLDDLLEDGIQTLGALQTRNAE